MANIIQKILNVEILLALGLLLVMVGQASYVPAAVSGALAPFAGIGALLVVVAAVLALYNKFKK